MVHIFFIKTFVSVAKSGSFRSAASENNITQPAVSGHIRQLEKRLKCTLFERSAKKNVLTPEGEIFLTYAQQILDLYQSAKSKIDELSTNLSGTIRIVSIHSMGLYLLKPVMQHFLKEYPQINIQLEYRQSERIYEMVRTNAIDFGLIALPEDKAGIKVKVFAYDKLVLVQSRKKPFFTKKNISLQDLNNVKLIAWDPHTPTGKMIIDFLQNREITPNLIKKSDNIETIKNAVEIGMGCSILPESTVQFELKTKLFTKIEVAGLQLQRPLAIIHSDHKIFSKSSRLFYDMITQKIK